MSPRVIFEQELKMLRDQVTEMGERAEISYDKLLLAINACDMEKLELLLDNDRQMTNMQRNIEAMCLTLLTKQQPVAKDLRLVTSALKVVTDIERIGDHVSDIAELYLRMGAEPEQSPYGEHISAMMEEAKGMLSDAVDAFVNGNEEQAQDVVGRDDIVDYMFNGIKDAMMEAIRNRTLDADKVVDILMIAKYLEKIGDHAVNIAEWAVFQVTGDMQGVQLY